MPSERTSRGYVEGYNKPSKIVPFKKKRSFKNVFVTLFLFVLVLVVLLFTPMFNINKIEVIGGEKFTQDQIIKMSGIPTGQNIFRVSLMKAKKSIKANSYIEEVNISRKLPSKVVIKVKERKPAAYFQFTGSFLIIDKEGLVLEVANSINNLKAPVILGVKFKDYKVGEVVNISKEDEAKFDIVKTCLKQIAANGMEQVIDKIDVNNPSKIVAWAYNDKYQINLADSQKLDYKFLFSKNVLAKRESEKGTSGTIDFVAENKAAFRPR